MAEPVIRTEGLTRSFAMGSTTVQALRGEWSVQSLAVGVVVGLAFVIGSRLAWRLALSKYTSASS